ncbi:transmembrane protein 47 isoform X2 [Pristis pectinata]|uniref:transmembrane protein 47 isoform X2 n=1 Tax=Pristis pectinata TaxID=685728 RepID=UPI00223E658A|nr:transmembrane protein 47 isoform X2 [Pristis pectinata]
MSTTEESQVTAVTPLKLTGLVCVVISLCLDVVALLSPAWVTADSHFSLSLWQRCFRAGSLPDSEWDCKWALDSVQPLLGKGKHSIQSTLGDCHGCLASDWSSHYSYCLSGGFDLNLSGDPSKILQTCGHPVIFCSCSPSMWTRFVPNQICGNSHDANIS